MALAEILKNKRHEVQFQKKHTPLANLRFQAQQISSKPKNFYSALKKTQGRPHFICELKKASPSRGIIRRHFEPKKIIKAFNSGGASAVSVLTDKKFFQGSIEIFKIVKQHTQLPVLRKEFIIDPYQVFESRIMGADCILLIVAALSELKLKSLFRTASQLGLHVLAEVHDERELRIALRIGARIIGINNRNLKTLKVDVNHAMTLLSKIPENVVCVVESGLEDPEDVKRYTRAGADAFLIGTSLMKARNIAGKLKSLKSKT